MTLEKIGFNFRQVGATEIWEDKVDNASCIYIYIYICIYIYIICIYVWRRGRTLAVKEGAVVGAEAGERARVGMARSGASAESAGPRGKAAKNPSAASPNVAAGHSRRSE